MSDCPQTETKQEVNEEWTNKKQTETLGESENQQTNDEGYDGDMEGDGGLMPPPSVIP